MWEVVSTDLQVDTTCGNVGSLCLGRVIDFVRIDIFVEGFANCKVEPFQELGQRFAFVANQHSQALMSVVCDGDAAHWSDNADGDLAMPNQFCNI